MQLGFVGLGRMGLNMVTRLARAGHAVVAYDRSPEAVTRAEAAGAEGAASLEALVSTLAAPKAIWLMVPAGDATESTVNALAALLSAGDIVIDGGNSNFHDDVRRAQSLGNQGDSLRRRRNERRYLGPRGRLLPHGRRRRRGLPAPGADLSDARDRRTATSALAITAPATT